MTWMLALHGFLGSEIQKEGTGGQQRIQKILKLSLSELIIICQGKGLKVYFSHYVIHIENILNVMMGYFTCVKWKKHGT